MKHVFKSGEVVIHLSVIEENESSTKWAFEVLFSNSPVYQESNGDYIAPATWSPEAVAADILNQASEDLNEHFIDYLDLDDEMKIIVQAA